MLEFRENAGAQDRDAAFVRACAVKMHMDISEEPFYAGLYRKNARAQDRDARFAGACAVQMDMGISQERFYARIYARFARAFAVEMHIL